METGEFAANMPMLFVMGVPGFGRQSQCCVMSLAKFMYVTFWGLNVLRTPSVADARAFERFSLFVNCMAFVGHSLVHMGQRMQRGEVIVALLFMICGRLFGQAVLHVVHPVHFVWLMSKLTVRCCCSFPSRVVHPMAMFFMAPPKPLRSCPLQCVITIIASAWAMAPETCISFSMPWVFMVWLFSLFRPSATMKGAMLKPFIIAVCMWSYALCRCAWYKVFESVRKGFPPASLIF